MTTTVDPGLIALSVFLFLVVIIFLASSLRIVREYERAVIFRLGRLLGAKGPGLFFRIPFIDKFIVVDLRVVTFDVSKQRIITKDNVSVDVDAVVYYRALDPIKAIVSVEHYMSATNLLAQTTLRDVIGQLQLDDLLSKREEIGNKLTDLLDKSTDAWGIKVTFVTVKDVILPDVMQRAIAKQAEAERDKRARIILAEGELIASQKMMEASMTYVKSPVAIRLRELQTLQEIARERNLIVVTPQSVGGSDLGTVLGMMQQQLKKPQG
ncbi:MAG: slipin family protein [Candidatus Bathyarchaeia archaeon]